MVQKYQEYYIKFLYIAKVIFSTADISIFSVQMRTNSIHMITFDAYSAAYINKV